MLAANAFLKINAKKVRNALAANNPVFRNPARLALMDRHDINRLVGMVALRPPPPMPARASGGGRSRAATPFACGAGTFGGAMPIGVRMISFPARLRRGYQPPRHPSPAVSTCPLRPFPPSQDQPQKRQNPLKTPEISLFTL